MSFKHEVTFSCDICDTNFMIDEEEMELPPGWFGMQVIIADSEGVVPEHERDVYSHFCSQKCLIEYVKSSDMRQRLLMADREEEDEDS